MSKLSNFNRTPIFSLFILWFVLPWVVVFSIKAWNTFPEWGMAFKRSVRALLGF